MQVRTQKGIFVSAGGAQDGGEKKPLRGERKKTLLLLFFAPSENPLLPTRSYFFRVFLVCVFFSSREGIGGRGGQGISACIRRIGGAAIVRGRISQTFVQKGNGSN